ncbi:Uncharacterised protein [Mycobacterium tuberculosis]|nr:Uncharacterised protein [Mycobacterium tuberculosis]CNM29817.1 Uncharacterised protein [Mycobacterium tuberculosis]COV93464.1 Uncharacterised protein [Mycobacterium tuberculosis]COW99520.1 Uncharacterised protein [Mycobacterium tuberculosis]COX94420.1 Uncharacterised protein [Mycobacterium tuberculosis]
MTGEQSPCLGEAGRVGGVAHNGVHVEFLRGDLEVAAAGTHQGDLVAVVAKAFSHCAPEIGIPAGDQHLHCHDLLVFNAEPRPWTVAWNRIVMA